MIKKYKTVIVAVILYLALFIFKREYFHQALVNSLDFLLEMVKVLPPVMIITALLSVWVPSSLISKILGKESGLKGIVISFITGAISAGPIYAAFPTVIVLFRKGASIKNMAIILSSWAVIKIPMLFVEGSFLGVKFTALRFIITIPVILGLSLIMERVVKSSDIEKDNHHDDLPNLNCGACGYSSCKEFKLSIDRGVVSIKECKVLKI